MLGETVFFFFITPKPIAAQMHRQSTRPPTAQPMMRFLQELGRASKPSPSPVMAQMPDVVGDDGGGGVDDAMVTVGSLSTVMPSAALAAAAVSRLVESAS